MNVTQRDLEAQLEAARSNGLLAILTEAAQRHAIPLAFVLGVASRETNIANVLGDVGHGVGVMQVDDQHALAREQKASGAWKSQPEILVDMACRMLSDNVRWAHSTWPHYDGFKIAAAAYNAGRGGASAGVFAGSCDKYTTGRDYGLDVLERTRLFQQLLGSC
jgi:soluble lytic murein transglycosylase-like protein